MNTIRIIGKEKIIIINKSYKLPLANTLQLEKEMC